VIMAMDAWVWIPFIMILLLAGLQRCPTSGGAAKVDGASPWQTFWNITFPLMLPVSDPSASFSGSSLELKLRHRHQRDGGRSWRGDRPRYRSFIYREYRDRSNVATAPCWPSSTG